jgi:hypothetical protein
LAIVALESNAAGQTTDSSNAIAIGIDGHCRVGHWTAVRYRDPHLVSAIETRDGDGVRVKYRSGQPAQWGYAIPGSEAAPLVVRSNDDHVVSSRFPTIGSPSRGPSMIPREMRWVIAFGDPLGIDAIGANKLLGRDAKIAVSRPTDASSLPDSTLGYDGVDMMVMGGSSQGLLESLDNKQQLAIRNWISEGGYLLMTLGKSSQQLLDAAPWLLEMLPLDAATTDQIDPSALETYTSTQTPLKTFEGIRLPKDQGRVIVMGRTNRRVRTPLAVRYNLGFGSVVVVAADLEDELFAAWPERMALLTQLTGSMLVLESEQVGALGRATAYDDLSGQLRASLDRFTTRRKFGFSIVSLILMALIAAIGPLDYLVVNRLLGRPLLGWVTFPLVAIGLSVVLVSQSQPVAVAADDGTSALVADLETNRIEIFDIDSINGLGRGFSASYFYSTEARSVDIEIVPDRSLQAINSQNEMMITAPFGIPGQAFGGIPIAVEDTRLPAYEVSFQTQDGSKTSRLIGLPIASRSSKGIVSRFRFAPQLSSEVFLQRRSGSELLEGELINPLPIDLLDGMLVYQNWAYRLPTRFPAGGRIVSVAGLRQKNFRWQLARQQALEESARQTEPWDPSKVDSLDRVAEMLMFHEAAGGSRYTTLRNDPLSALDLSHVLADDRCMLVGRVGSPLTRMDATRGESVDDQPVVQHSGDNLSLIRVVLPVRQRGRQ